MQKPQTQSMASRPAWTRHPSLVVGAALSLLLLVAAALALVWTPWPVEQVDMAVKLQLPSTSHWLGTDPLGRDVVSLLLAGASNSILVGVVAVGIGLIAGTGLGLLAAARGGWLEEVIMRAVDLSFAFPAILSAIMLTALYGASIVNSMLAIGIFNVPVFARLSRGCAKALLQREFVLAARACGRSPWAIVWVHVLPNIASVLIVQVTLQFALAILAEAALSYLGLGTQPPHPSWGRMLSEAQTLLFEAPRLALFPGLAIAMAVMGLNLLGDGLRDLFDPRWSQRR